MMMRPSGLRVGQRAAWVPPTAAAVAATGYLAWGAWVSAADERWLFLGQEWWRVWLRPSQVQAPVIVVALWLAALACYWWPRRLQPQLVGITSVVTMVVTGGVLAASSLAPCRGGETESAVLGWVLDLYLGNPPAYPSGACQGQPPLALQLGSVVCLGATLVGALAAAAVLWRQPVARLRARLVRDATVFTGLDATTLPLLRRLAETGHPASIVVIEPDSSHHLLDEARATGARVMIGHPASARVLLPVLAARRGCALRRLYALRQSVPENEAILTAAKSILGHYRPDPERLPHLVARIDDPRHADHWRSRRIGASTHWFEDALSARESTSCGLVDQVFRTRARQLLLCGDSTLALAVLRELARRAWEWREMTAAAALGRAGRANAAAPDAGPELARIPLERIVLMDRRAGDLLREYLATSTRAISEALPDILVQSKSWKDELLAMLDALPPAEASTTAVAVADIVPEGSMHEAGRIARLHPSIPVFVLTSGETAVTDAIFDQLHPFQHSLLVNQEIPEDSWTRVARHWHECFRLQHPPAPREPRARTGRPWADLDNFIRQDNILQLRSVMAAVVDRGRRWVPGRAVPPGSFIELGTQDLAEIASAEHTRWYKRRLAAGWSAGAGHDGASTAEAADALVTSTLVNQRVVPWADLPARDRAAAITYVKSQLAQLEDVGFMPVVPAGGPPGAADFERIGTVRAKRLRGYQPWTRLSGDELIGGPGDWRVLDDSGDERTIGDDTFRASHEPVDGETWRRTGTFRAWRVSEVLMLRTMEGRAIAQPGDWIVEGCRGERWPVTDDQFRRTYRRTAKPGRAVGRGQVLPRDSRSLPED